MRISIRSTTATSGGGSCAGKGIRGTNRASAPALGIPDHRPRCTTPSRLGPSAAAQCQGRMRRRPRGGLQARVKGAEKHVTPLHAPPSLQRLHQVLSAMKTPGAQGPHASIGKTTSSVGHAWSKRPEPGLECSRCSAQLPGGPIGLSCWGRSRCRCSSRSSRRCSTAGSGRSERPTRRGCGPGRAPARRSSAGSSTGRSRWPSSGCRRTRRRFEVGTLRPTRGASRTGRAWPPSPGSCERCTSSTATGCAGSNRGQGRSSRPNGRPSCGPCGSAFVRRAAPR